LDVNGTLTNRGVLIDEVEDRLRRLRGTLEIRLVSADTFGTLDAIAERLQVGGVRAGSGEDKLRALDELGRDRCAVIGHGANDVLVLEAAAVSFAVLGPDGVSAAAMRCADVVCASATDALAARPEGAVRDAATVVLMHWCYSCYAVNPRPARPRIRRGQLFNTPAGRSFGDELVWALGHPDGDLAVPAAKTLGVRAVRSALPALQRAVDKDRDQYLAVVARPRVIAMAGSHELRGWLGRFVQSESFMVREESQRALA